MATYFSCKLGLHNYIEVLNICSNGTFIVDMCIKCKKKRMYQIKSYKGQEKLILINCPDRFKKEFASLGLGEQDV